MSEDMELHCYMQQLCNPDENKDELYGVCIIGDISRFSQGVQFLLTGVLQLTYVLFPARSFIKNHAKVGHKGDWCNGFRKKYDLTLTGIMTKVHNDHGWEVIRNFVKSLWKLFFSMDMGHLPGRSN